MENYIEDIIGEFTYTLYQNENFMICKFKTDDGNITVTGNFFNYEKRIKYHLFGQYVDHPKYGLQFNYDYFDKYVSNNKKDIINFLSSKSFKGIGNKTANKIYDYFGENILEILKEKPNRIDELSLNDIQTNSIKNYFYNLTNNNETLFYLISNGFSNKEANKIYATFKDNTIDVANVNPFRFYIEIYGINFSKVKNFASRIEFEDSLIKYQEAILIYILKEYTFNSGNIYINYDELLEISNKNQIYNLDDLLNMAIKDSYIIFEKNHIYLKNDYEDERFIANFLNKFIDKDENDFIVDDYINEFELENNIKYDVNQITAINNFFSNSFSMIMGGPGTGKTTIVKTITNIFKKVYPYQNIVLVAPTGRAAKRLGEVCDNEAKTIHSLLRWNKETDTFVYDINNPLLVDAIIIDEFSMVDNNLFASLLKASRNIKKICIIGDHNQLPSIKPGNLIDDLLHYSKIEKIYLDTNYRQKQGNQIIDLCYDVLKNDVKYSKYNKDVTFINPKNESYDLISMINEDLNNGFNLNEIIIITPMYNGEQGIDKLNVLIQDAYNPSSNDKKEKKIGKYTFREGDKILQLKNRPNDDVYNGDIGILLEIDEDEEILLVDFQGINVFYSFDDLSDISLAYAMSIHKSQGNEYQVVYLILNKNNTYMLNKNLIYTAISRAKNKLVIISEDSLFTFGINKLSLKRNTTLLNILNYEE